jgi:pimeloyl-ACP methyl ester carboxylesterase
MLSWRRFPHRLLLLVALAAFSNASAQHVPRSDDPSPPPPLPEGVGLVQTAWSDPEWIIAASDVILRSTDCVAECDQQHSTSWYERTFLAPCYNHTRFWKLDGTCLATVVPMAPLGVGTFDGLFVRDGIYFQLYAGSQTEVPFGPLMVGPQFVSIDVWRDYPACEGFEPGTFFVTGGPGALGGYSIVAGIDGPAVPGVAAERPPIPDDRTFVLDTDTPLDTYRCSSGTPFEFDIPVTRFAGPTNAAGNLTQINALKQHQLIGTHATLLLMCWDVDSSLALPGVKPEMDRVYFNGELVSSLYPGNSLFLTGVSGGWSLNTFRIPIEKVCFPLSPGPSGLPPVPAYNQVRIEVDVANSPGHWAVAVDWAALQIDAMSPIVFIHGLHQNGDFFQRRGFTLPLDERGLVMHNTMLLPTSSYDDCGDEIERRLPNVASEFGVDSLHLVCHSKGGLDTRAYLADYQRGHDAVFRVLSYTSLASPHDGSVLADMVVERAAAAQRSAAVEFQGFPAFTGLIASMIASDPGYEALQVAETFSFNMTNVPALPRNVVYNAVTGDIDVTGNGRIDLVPDEFADLRAEDASLRNIFNTPVVGPFLAQAGVNAAYLSLRGTQSLYVTTQTRIDGTIVAVIRGVPPPEPVMNDVLVSIASGLGSGTGLGPNFGQRIFESGGHTYVFSGAQGRNHSNIADGGVAEVVLPWIADIERAKGDLKPR